MTTGPLRSRGPIVAIERLQLLRRVDLTGLGEQTLHRFERQVLWLRETTSTWRVTAHGKTLKEGATHNDWYGFMTSLGEILASAHELAADIDAAPGGGLAVEVWMEIVDEAVLPPAPGASPPLGRGGRTWTPAPGDWCVDDEATAGWLTAAPFTAAPTRLERAPLRLRAWSSAATDAENAEALFGLAVIGAASVDLWPAETRQEAAQP